MVQMTLETHRIETELARAIRAFLSSDDAAARREISSGLQFLLEARCADRGVLPSRWFDGLVLEVSTLRKQDPHRLDVRGLMIWGDVNDSRRFWVDLFSADLRVSKTRDDLEEYELRFGRKGSEERRILYRDYGQLKDELQDLGGVPWAYVFSKKSPS
jgi:hypothetical protein